VLEPARGLRVLPMALNGADAGSSGDLLGEETVRQSHSC